MRQGEAGSPLGYHLRTIIAAATALAALAGVATAEPGPIGRWLMKQPVTLWDRGMDRADAAARRSAASMKPMEGSNLSGHAFYDWDNNEIGLYLNVTWDPGAITHERCNDLRRGFVAALVHDGPDEKDHEAMSVAAAVGGSHLLDEPARMRRLLTRMIGEWFSHYGYRKQDRDAKLGEKMARIVFVEVYLQGAYGKGSVECRGRILEFEAASKPSG